MRPALILEIGDEAPDFCLPAATVSDGNRIKQRICLSDFLGRQPVVAEFFGAAFTPT
jgi:peroxiredoxin